MLTDKQKEEYIATTKYGEIKKIYCKSHNRADIELGIDYVSYAGAVVFHNAHDVEIPPCAFSNAIKRAAQDKGVDVIIISCPCNSWIHEGIIYVFRADLYSVK